MRVKPIQFALAALATTAAFGQTTTSKVFSFTYAQAPTDIQQITNAVRTVGEMTQVAFNPGAKTLTVTGTPVQLATTAWIFSTLDQAAPANQATQEFRPAGSVNDVLRILYLTHPQTMQGFQEIVNAIRTIPEMTKVFPSTAQSAIVMRGVDSQVASAEWLFHQLDLPAGVQPVQDPAAHRYALPPDAVGSQHVTNDTMQVLFLAHAWSPQSMQQIVNTVRTIPQLTKVFPCSATGAVAVRGPAATLALAAWLFKQLDQAPQTSSPGPREYQMTDGADDVTQVFYLAPATTVVSFQSIVTALRGSLKLVFPDEIWNAITLRGTAVQIAAADVLIQQMNQP